MIRLLLLILLVIDFVFSQNEYEEESWKQVVKTYVARDRIVQSTLGSDVQDVQIGNEIQEAAPSSADGKADSTTHPEQVEKRLTYFISPEIRLTKEEIEKNPRITQAYRLLKNGFVRQLEFGFSYDKGILTEIRLQTDEYWENFKWIDFKPVPEKKHFQYYLGSMSVYSFAEKKEDGKGSFIFYDRKGNVVFSMETQNEVIRGQLKKFALDGSVEEIYTYENNVEEGPSFKYKNNLLIEEGSYSGGKKDGAFTHYTRDSNGKQVVDYIEYFNKDVLYKRDVYKQGFFYQTVNQ